MPLPCPGSLASCAPAWQQPLERLVVGEVPEPSLIDLDDLDEDDPASFYLPGSSAETAGSSYEELADAFAVVDDARLPLHSQLLAARSAVLRAALLERAESSCADPAQVIGRCRQECVRMKRHGHAGSIPCQRSACYALHECLQHGDAAG